MEIIENADGTVSVRGDAGTILSTQATRDDLRAWLIQEIAPAGSAWSVDDAAAWVDQMMAGTLPPPNPNRCHYCGLPTRRGNCDECGTEPRMLTR